MTIFKNMFYLPVAAVFLLASVAPIASSAEQKDETGSEQGSVSAEVAAELEPKPELGAREMSELSEEAQAELRRRLASESYRVMPPVPEADKRAFFTNMAAASPVGMREMFNLMTDKMKVADDVSFDDVIEAMDLKANEVNFKKTGHSMIWQDVAAITGLPTTRVEVLQYCDAIVGREMMNFSPEFSIFIPCRITVYEDATGEIWLMTMDWDVNWLAFAWHPDSKLPENLKKEGKRVRDAIRSIMEAGATGEW